MDKEYLWDKSGEPDPAVADIERRLAPLKLKPRRSSLSTPRVALLAAAAALLVVGVASHVLAPDPGGWALTTLAGADCGDCRAHPGEWIETDGITSLRLAVADIGVMDLDPRTRLRIVDTGPEGHRLQLERGRIAARVRAPPRLLIVDTPVASAVDLGCMYTLDVESDGAGRLEVTLGEVALESPSRVARVPAGAAAWMRPGFGPGTPLFTDASPAFSQAIGTLDFGTPSSGTLQRALELAGPRDTLSLWHQLQRVPEENRREVWDRIAALEPGLPLDPEALLRLEEMEIGSLWVGLSASW